MLPIDEDVLQSRYGDDPMAAGWYRHWRSFGGNPHEAIQAVDDLVKLRDQLFPSQIQALERYADAAEGAMEVLRRTSAMLNIPPEQIHQLVAEAQRVAALIRDQLTHSQTDSRCAAEGP